MKRVALSIALAMIASVASADDLLIIDLSVTDQITITATDGLSDVTTTGSDVTGVYFEDFYAGPGSALTETLVAGDITNAENPADFTPELFRGGGGSDPGLNLWSWSTDFTVSFTAGETAFTGSATWTLDSAAYADMLAGGATGGDIYFAADTEDDLPGAQVIGTYAVVTNAIPEPGSAALIGFAMGLMAVRRRR
jgi:hypothetical protein